MRLPGFHLLPFTRPPQDPFTTPAPVHNFCFKNHKLQGIVDTRDGKRPVLRPYLPLSRSPELRTRQDRFFVLESRACSRNNPGRLVLSEKIAGWMTARLTFNELSEMAWS